MSQFANLPQIGTLTLEHTFYEYGEPILFVCTDQAANRYLCSCCRLSEEWLIAKTCPEDLIEIIDDKLAFSDVFHNQRSSLFFLKWDGDKFSLSNNVPADAYPDVDSYLELPADCTAEYRNMLESHSSDCSAWESPSYFAKLTLPSITTKCEGLVELRTCTDFAASLLGHVQAHTLADTNWICSAYEKQILKIPSAAVIEQESQKIGAEQSALLGGFLRCAA